MKTWLEGNNCIFLCIYYASAIYAAVIWRGSMRLYETHLNPLRLGIRQSLYYCVKLFLTITVYKQIFVITWLSFSHNGFVSDYIEFSTKAEMKY